MKKTKPVKAVPVKSRGLQNTPAKRGETTRAHKKRTHPPSHFSFFSFLFFFVVAEWSFSVTVFVTKEERKKFGFGWAGGRVGVSFWIETYSQSAFCFQDEGRALIVSPCGAVHVKVTISVNEQQWVYTDCAYRYRRGTRRRVSSCSLCSWACQRERVPVSSLLNLHGGNKTN